MPGKVNPTQAEALIMVSTQVLGNDVAVGLAGASGNLELNVQKPLLARNALHSSRLLSDAMASFERRLVAGIEPDRGRLAAYVEQSLMLATALSPHVGYDKAASIASKAHREGITLRQAAIELGVLDGASFDRLVRPERMLGPSVD